MILLCRPRSSVLLTNAVRGVVTFEYFFVCGFFAFIDRSCVFVKC